MLFLLMAQLVVSSGQRAVACEVSGDPGPQPTLNSPNVVGSTASLGVGDQGVTVVYRNGASHTVVEVGTGGARAYGARTNGGSPDSPLTRPGSWAFQVDADPNAPSACAGSPANGLVVRVP